MKVSMKKLFSPSTWLAGMILMAGVVLALRVRLSLLDFSSGDYANVLRKWFETLLNSGFSALGGDFYNYTPAYLYLLYLSVRLMLVLPLSGKRLRMMARAPSSPTLGGSR